MAPEGFSALKEAFRCMFSCRLRAFVSVLCMLSVWSTEPRRSSDFCLKCVLRFTEDERDDQQLSSCMINEAVASREHPTRIHCTISAVSRKTGYDIPVKVVFPQNKRSDSLFYQNRALPTVWRDHKPVEHLRSSAEVSIPGITRRPSNPGLIKRAGRLALIVEAQGRGWEPGVLGAAVTEEGSWELTWPQAEAVTFSSAGLFYLCQPTCVSHDGSWHLPEGNNYHGGEKKCGERRGVAANYSPNSLQSFRCEYLKFGTATTRVCVLILGFRMCQIPSVSESGAHHLSAMDLQLALGWIGKVLPHYDWSLDKWSSWRSEKLSTLSLFLSPPQDEWLLFRYIALML